MSNDFLLFLIQVEYVTEKLVTESEHILEILVYFSMFYFILWYL
jgi:hypothetical protein